MRRPPAPRWADLCPYCHHYAPALLHDGCPVRLAKIAAVEKVQRDRARLWGVGKEEG